MNGNKVEGIACIRDLRILTLGFLPTIDQFLKGLKKGGSEICLDPFLLL
jgi:hypothetical protein